MKKSIFFYSLISLAVLTSCTSNQSSYQVSGQSCSICSDDFSSNSTITSGSNNSTFALKPNNVKPSNTKSKGKNSYSSFLSIINSALEYNSNVSSLPSLIEQRKAEAEIIRKNNWPAIQPVARYSSQTSPYVGLSASYTLWDFGSSKHKEKQGDLAIDNSQLDFLIEEREVIATTLESLVKISSLIENRDVLTSSIKSITKLSQLADIRYEAGMASISESNTLNLRLAELKSDLDAVNIEINLNLDLLSAKLLHPVSLADIPNLRNITSELLPDLGNESLQLRQAEINKDIAYAQYEQAKSDIYPHLAVEGEVGKATSGDSIHTVGLALKLPVSIFAREATVNAAESAYLSAEKKVAQIQTQVDTENKRIMLEANRLNNNKNTLINLEKKGLNAIKVFDSEFEFGGATLSDGLSAHRTLLQTRQQLISLQRELLNLQASKIRITNGPIFNTLE